MRRKRLYKPKLRWFKSIKIIEHLSRYRLAVAGKHFTPTADSLFKKKLINIKSINKFGTLASIDGLPTRLYSITDMCDLFKVNRLTFLKWWNNNYIPEPYTSRQIRVDGQVSSYWTYSQVYCIAYVFNDLARQGARNLLPKYRRHYDLLIHGAALELSMELNIGKQHVFDTAPKIDKPKKSKKTVKTLGVMWD